jgi:ATP-dependent helicase HrpA
MFLEHALVRGEFQTRGEFQAHNRALMAEVARQRDKARQSELLIDDEALLAFFDRRVPEHVNNGKGFEAWRQTAEVKTPDVLRLQLADLLSSEDRLEPGLYPESIALHGVEIPLSYRFDPSAENDGITLSLPLPLLLQLEPGELDWTIPGWHEQKITALLSELPRALRRELGSIPALAAAVAAQLRPFQGPLLPALSRVASQISGSDLPEEAFRLDAVPPYMRLTCRLVGEGGRTVAESRDVAALFRQYGSEARAAFARSAPAAHWQRTGVTQWDFGELPEFVVRRVGGVELRSYPALIDRQKSVDLSLLESARAAEAATRRGVRRLLALAAKNPLSVYGKQVPAPFARRSGFLASRAEIEAQREIFLERVVEEAFECSDAALIPRNRAAFEGILAAGVPRIAAAFKRIERAVALAAAELQTTLRALDGAAKHPSGTAASAEIRTQVELLFPENALATVALGRLEHYPRYLRAAQARLIRAVSDPRKDADKLAPFAPLWLAFLNKHSLAADREAAHSLRWSFEELRVAIFAPELKPALPVTLASVQLALSTLR